MMKMLKSALTLSEGVSIQIVLVYEPMGRMMSIPQILTNPVVTLEIIVRATD